jgi:RHS repeat-associated protein
VLCLLLSAQVGAGEPEKAVNPYTGNLFVDGDIRFAPAAEAGKPPQVYLRTPRYWKVAGGGKEVQGNEIPFDTQVKLKGDASIRLDGAGGKVAFSRSGWADTRDTMRHGWAYRAGVWLKLKDVKGKAYVRAMYSWGEGRSKDLAGTLDWTEVPVEFTCDRNNNLLSALEVALEGSGTVWIGGLDLRMKDPEAFRWWEGWNGAPLSARLSEDGSVDGAVQRIARSYDALGRLIRVTSYDAPTGGNVVNEVAYEYNAWDQVSASRQSHGGAVVAQSPTVQYGYEGGSTSGAVSHVRLSSVTYPNGRQVFYNYPSSGVGAALSRLGSISANADGTSPYAEFGYLGADNTIVQETRPLATTPASNLQVVYGLDALGRTASVTWTVGSTVIDSFAYAYDGAGNRTSRVAQFGGGVSINDAYAYDGLNRLMTNGRSVAYDSNLLAWYAFEEDENNVDAALDSSGNGHDGSLENDPTRTAGLFQGTLSFDGTNDYVTVPNTNGAFSLDSFSIAGWFKTDDSSDFGPLVARGASATSQNFWVGIWKTGEGGHTGGTLVFQTTSGGDVDVNLDSGSLVVADGKWHSFAAVLEQQGSAFEARLYVDGELVDDPYAADAPDTPANAPLLLGADVQGDHFLGELDEVRLYAGAIPAPAMDLSQSWALDALGNPESLGMGGDTQTVSHNAANEMGPFESSGTEWATPEYDAAGNMISGPRPGAETTALHYVYDAWNRMVKVTDASDETVAEYQYDGLNRRVVKLLWNASSETWSRTDYYYNEEWQVLEEREAVGVSTVDKGEVATDASVQYLWDPKYIDSPILRWRNANTSNADLEEVLYYTADANMNVTALVDDSGEVVERDVYAAYGTAMVLEPDGNPKSGNASGVANEVGYSGYRKDPETGLWYVRMRYLQPSISVWLQRDPLPGQTGQYPDGANLYQYVGSNPANALDPSGLLKLSNHVAVTEAALWLLGDSKDPLFSHEFRMSFFKGVCNPDLMFLKEADRATYSGIAIELSLLYKVKGDTVGIVKDPLKELEWKIEKGVAHVVLPGFAYNGLRGIRNWWQDTSFAEPVVRGADKGAEAVAPWCSGIYDVTDPFYRTHWGNLAWQHAMYVKGWTATRIRSELVKGSAMLIEDARDMEDKRQFDRAAFALGMALHYLQDSYTLGHASRNEKGEITRFQDYNKQSPHLHAEEDEVSLYSQTFWSQVMRSVELIQVFQNRTIKGEELRTYLRDHFYPLARNAQAGDSETRFEPRS